MAAFGAPVTSGHAPLRGPPPTINIVRRGITVTSAAPWPQQQQQPHQQPQQPGQGPPPMPGAAASAAGQYVPGVAALPLEDWCAGAASPQMLVEGHGWSHRSASTPQ